MLVENYNNDTSNCSGYILIGVTLSLTLLDGGWDVYQYLNYRCGGGMSMVIFSITCVGIALMYLLVVLRVREDASVLTSAIASLYCLYL